MIKCKTEKVKLTNYHKGFLSKSFFVYCNILSNTYVIYVFEKFLTFSFKKKTRNFSKPVKSNTFGKFQFNT